LAVAVVAGCVCSLNLAGCGQNQYFAGRNLPPSGILNRCLVAIQNPSPASKGALEIMDAYYDIRHAYNNINTTYTISGFSGADPVTIQNFAAQQTGVVYGEGDGSLSLINYATEKESSTVTGFGGSNASSSIFASQNLEYYAAASQQVHAFTILDQTLNTAFPLNVTDIYRVSINPSGTVALGFVQNSNAVYSLVHLTSAQQQQLKGGPSTWPTLLSSINPNETVQDCEPANLPVYCAIKLYDPNQVFDRPIRTIFSSDGSTAYIVNCGPECGGQQAGIVSIPLTGSTVNQNVTGPSAINLTPNATVIAVPGGATDALQNGTTLYVAGQQLQTTGPYAGLFAGNLSVVNLTTGAVQGPFSISDGTHTKMILGDDNTLWIGAQGCEEGVRYAESQGGNSSVALGCLTLFNTASVSQGSVAIDTYKGDLTGITSIAGLHKMYVAEGGQVHIYNTPGVVTSGVLTITERDNTNVTVTGTAYDVAYMDATSDGDDANY